MCVVMVKEPQPKDGYADFEVKLTQDDHNRGRTPIMVHNANIKRKYGVAGAPKYLRGLAGVDFAASVMTAVPNRKGLIFNDGMKKRSMFIANDGGVALRLRTQMATVIRNRVLSVMPKTDVLARGGYDMLYPPGYGRDEKYGTASKAPQHYATLGSSSTYEEMLDATTTGFMAIAGNYHFMGRLTSSMPKDPRRGLVNHKVPVTRDEAVLAHTHCGFLHAPGVEKKETVWVHFQPKWRDDPYGRLSLNAEIGADGKLNTKNAIKVNLKADLGVPYCAKGTNADALAAAFAVARAIDSSAEYNADPAGFYKRDFNRAPWRVTTMGKTKTDIYKLKKLKDAGMRFVNVLPAHLKMMVARTTQRYDGEKTSLVKQSAYWQDHISWATGPASLDDLKEGIECMKIGTQRYLQIADDQTRVYNHHHELYFGDWPGLQKTSQEVEQAYLDTNKKLRTAQKVGMTQETPGLILNCLDVQLRDDRCGWVHCGDDTILVFRTVGFESVHVSAPDGSPTLVDMPYFRYYCLTTDFSSFDLTQDLTVLAENVNVTAEAMSHINPKDAALWKAIINERKVLLVDGGVVDMKNGGASGVNLQSSLNDMHTDVFCQRFNNLLLAKCKVGRLGRDPKTGAIVQLAGNITVPPPHQVDATNPDTNMRMFPVDAFYHPDPLSKEEVEQIAMKAARSLGFEVTLGSFACCDNRYITSDTYRKEDAKWFDGPYKWDHPVTTWMSLEKLAVPFLGMDIMASMPLATYKPYATKLVRLYDDVGFPPPTFGPNGDDISPHRRVIKHARMQYTSIYLDERCRTGGGIFRMRPQDDRAAKTRDIFRHELDGGEVADLTYIDEDGDRIHYYEMLPPDRIRPLSECTPPAMCGDMGTIGVAQVQLSRAVKNLLYSGKVWVKDKNEFMIHDCVRLLSMLGNWGCLGVSSTLSMAVWEQLVSRTQNYHKVHADVPPYMFEEELANEAALFFPTPGGGPHGTGRHSYGPWPVNALPYDGLLYSGVCNNEALEVARFDAVNWLMMRLAEQCKPSRNAIKEMAKDSSEMYNFFASDPDSNETNPIAMAVLSFFQDEPEEMAEEPDGLYGRTATLGELSGVLPRAVLAALFSPNTLNPTDPKSSVGEGRGRFPVFPNSTIDQRGLSYTDVPKAMRRTPAMSQKLYEEFIRDAVQGPAADRVVSNTRLKDHAGEAGVHWFLKSNYTRIRLAVINFYEVANKVYGRPFEATISSRLARQNEDKRVRHAVHAWFKKRFPNKIAFKAMYPDSARAADRQACVDGAHGMNFLLNTDNLRDLNGRALCVQKLNAAGEWDAEYYYQMLCRYCLVASEFVPNAHDNIPDGSMFVPFGGPGYHDDPSWGRKSIESMILRIRISEMKFDEVFTNTDKALNNRNLLMTFIQNYSTNRDEIFFGPRMTLRLTDLRRMNNAVRIMRSTHQWLGHAEMEADPNDSDEFVKQLKEKVDGMEYITIIPDSSSMDPTTNANGWGDLMDEDEAPTSVGGRQILSADYLWNEAKSILADDGVHPGVAGVPSLKELALRAIGEAIFSSGKPDGGLDPIIIDEVDPVVDLMERMMTTPEFPDLSNVDLRPRDYKRQKFSLVIADPSEGAVKVPKNTVDERMRNLRPITEKNFGRPPPNKDIRDATAVAISEGGAPKTVFQGGQNDPGAKLTKTQKRNGQKKRAAERKRGGFSSHDNLAEQEITQQEEDEQEAGAAERVNWDRVEARARAMEDF